MKILLVAVGKPKEKAIETLVNKYLERSRQFASIDKVTVKDYSGKNPVEKIKTRETENIFKVLKPRDYVILLDRKGQEFDSVEFASFLEKQFLTRSHLVFIVGGALGISNAVKKRANTVISISKMTFTHQMSVLILLEQLFRAFKIIKNQKYHY